ncbi:phage major capsid protein [Arthrobacter rhombi]|uniref:phage major capsid protein n=1 Tax=Arthrobacter rhombi TaxID=71253 RepID=UPI003FD23120
MNLKEQRSTEIQSAQSIVDGAKAAKRELTGREQETVEAHFKAIEKLDANIERDAKSADLFARVAGIAPGSSGEKSEDALDQQKKGDLVNALGRKGSYAFNMPLRVKAPATDGGLTAPTGGVVSEGLPGPTMIALRSLLSPEHTETPNLRYYQFNSGTAEVVAEGALKPDAGLEITPVDDVLKKIATTFKFSSELLEDASFLVEHLQKEALRGVLAKENELIVNALDGASGAMTATGATADAIDVLAGAIGASTAANGVNVAHILMNPSDLAAIRVAKSSGSGEFILDPLAAGPATLLGIPVTATPAVAAGKMFLLSDGFGAFYSRQNSVHVDTGYDSDDWMKNLITGRAEERILPVVIRPSLVTVVTLTA